MLERSQIAEQPLPHDGQEMFRTIARLGLDLLSCCRRECLRLYWVVGAKRGLTHGAHSRCPAMLRAGYEPETVHRRTNPAAHGRGSRRARSYRPQFFMVDMLSGINSPGADGLKGNYARAARACRDRLCRRFAARSAARDQSWLALD